MAHHEKLTAEHDKNDGEMTLVTTTSRGYYSYVAMTIHSYWKSNF